MSAQIPSIQQYGVIAWRRGAEHGVEILLITSRETGRWVVPRGNPIPGLRPHEAAAQEAFEEAGVRGGVQEEPLGAYRYAKRRRDGLSVPADVELFPMLVTEEAHDWPEKHQRRRRWSAPEDAAAAVEEADLAALIRQMAEFDA